MKNFPQWFKRETLEGIANTLGDTGLGLSNSEIDRLGAQAGLPRIATRMGYSKKDRLFDMFADSQNRRKNNQTIVNMVLLACAPGRFLERQDTFEGIRSRLNRVLAFEGVAISERGKFVSVRQADTILDANRRARELRSDLKNRGVHPDVLAFCQAELLEENYFHAVLEAVKSVAHKMRERTGLLDDGAILAQHVFGGAQPILAINHLETKSELDEQKGFCNLVIGVFGMFRNPTAHEAKILWDMRKEDAEDLLSLVSLIHRRIDNSTMPPRH